MGWDDNLRRASLCIPQSSKYLSAPGMMIIIKLYYKIIIKLYYRHG